MLPVVLYVLELPIVIAPRFVAANVPSPVRYTALFPEFAEILAVGVPLLTFRKANFAEVVACAPRRKSTVEFFGAIAPFVSENKLVPPTNVLGSVHCGALPL